MFYHKNKYFQNIIIFVTGSYKDNSRILQSNHTFNSLTYYTFLFEENEYYII